MHEKENRYYATYATRPKLLSDHVGSRVLSHYAVTYEETLILRSSDLQLMDEGKIHVVIDFPIVSNIHLSKNCVAHSTVEIQFRYFPYFPYSVERAIHISSLALNFFSPPQE